MSLAGVVPSKDSLSDSNAQAKPRRDWQWRALEQYSGTRCANAVHLARKCSARTIGDSNTRGRLSSEVPGRKSGTLMTLGRFPHMDTGPDISTRSRIGLLIYGMANAVLFGIGIVTVLSVESLSQHAWILIPLVVVVSLIVAWPIAWLVAPRLRKPLWRRRQLATEGEPVGTPEERRELAARAAAAGRPELRQ